MEDVNGGAVEVISTAPEELIEASEKLSELVEILQTEQEEKENEKLHIQEEKKKESEKAELEKELQNEQTTDLLEYEAGQIIAIHALQMEIRDLNENMELLHEEKKDLIVETALLVSFSIIISFAIKILVDQISKW